MSIYDKEPVVLIGAIVGVIEAGIAMLVVLGVLSLTPEQIGAIMAFVIAIGSVVSILLTRSVVTPVANPRDNDGNRLVPYIE